MHRWIRVLICAGLIGVAVADAAAAQEPQLSPAVRDCVADGRVDGHYTDAALRRAIRELPQDAAAYTPCETRLERVLRHGGDGRIARSGSVEAVYRDCADGMLDWHWPTAKLEAAQRVMPADLETYTRCDELIADDLGARSR